MKDFECPADRILASFTSRDDVGLASTPIEREGN
jgi:hypothetical protein